MAVELIAPNGRIIADSGEGYRRKAGAVNGFMSLSRSIRAGKILIGEAKAEQA